MTTGTPLLGCSDNRNHRGSSIHLPRSRSAASNYRIDPPAGGGHAPEGHLRSPAAGHAERYTD